MAMQKLLQKRMTEFEEPKKKSKIPLTPWEQEQERLEREKAMSAKEILNLQFEYSKQQSERYTDPWKRDIEKLKQYVKNREEQEDKIIEADWAEHCKSIKLGKDELKINCCS